MSDFKHPVDPERSWISTRNGAVRIKVIKVDHHDSNGLAFIEGISKTTGKALANGGFTVPIQDFEGLCRAFLVHLDKERGTPDPQAELLDTLEAVRSTLVGWQMDKTPLYGRVVESIAHAQERLT